MKALIGTAGLALALLVGGCGEDKGGGTQAATNTAGGPALKQVEAPNGDWTQAVVKTPEGGYLMGNPNAPVKLVEYGSITCPHCAEFSEQATQPLMNNYVKTGQVSYEFRPYLLFPTDPGVSMLLNCQGPGPFFRLVEQLYADQRSWMGRVQSLPEAQLEQLQSLPPQQRAAELVRAAGLDQFFRQRGMPAARVQACLSDEQGLQQLLQITQRANEQGVQGTPTFFINGELIQGVGTWADLEPRLRKAASA